MSNREKNIWGYDPYHHVGFQYFMRTSKFDDEIAIVLKAHLFIEYLLNEIISFKYRSPKKILSDHRNFTFAAKLQTLYSTGFIPDHLQKNISKLNTIRNNLAHKLDVEFDKIEMTWYLPDDRLFVLKPKNQRNRVRYFLKTFCYFLIQQLALYMLIELKLSPVYGVPTITIKQTKVVKEIVNIYKTKKSKSIEKSKGRAK